jgi:3-phenylpropionate/trans-cinnamate dioxygenase ferredoxin subunit
VSRHVVATVAEVPPGSRRRVVVQGRPIAIFNLGGQFFGLADRCPHQGASLCEGLVTGLAIGDAPGEFRIIRDGEMVRCPWHGWEFDIRTGKSWCDPQRTRAKQVTVEVAPGIVLAEGPFVAETITVSVEEDYLVVDA